MFFGNFAYKHKLMLTIAVATIRREKYKGVISLYWILPLVLLGRSYYNKLQDTSQIVSTN